jgi:hypothetical protein
MINIVCGSLFLAIKEENSLDFKTDYQKNNPINDTPAMRAVQA